MQTAPADGAPAPLAESDGERKPREQSVWKILRRVYRYSDLDGSVDQRIVYVCPSDGCEHESPDLAGTAQHVEEVHGVSLHGGPKQDIRAPRWQIHKVRTPCGEDRLVCPSCIMQFAVDEEALMMEHLASEHGTVCVLAAAGGNLGGHSDHLDLLYMAANESWHPRREQVLARMRVVSLGSFCSMKSSIQKLGLGDLHMPFDWIRSSSEGVRHFVQSDFQGFFSVANKCELPGMTVYRSQHHSFWHDDVTQREIREKMQRRIDRFLALRDDPRDLLFLRSCASSGELLEAEALHAALEARFGSKNGQPRRRILLGLILDDQDAALEGPFFNEDLPGIVLTTQKFGGDKSAGPVYCAAAAAIISAALSKPPDDRPAGFGVEQGAPQWRCSVANGSNLIRNGQVAPLRFSDMGLHSGFPGLRSFVEPGVPHFDLRTAAESCAKVPQQELPQVPAAGSA